MDLLQCCFVGLTVFLLIPAAQSATNQTNGTESMGGTSHPPMNGTLSTGSTAATIAASLTAGISTEEPIMTQTDIIPTQSPGKSLTMLAFGVMSLILILIIIMAVLLTVVNLRERCSNSKEGGKKSSDSVVSESNFTSNGEKESITLVSMKSINSETDADSPQVSSIHSTTLSYEEQEVSRDLLDTKLV